MYSFETSLLMKVFSGALNRLLGNVVVSHDNNIVTISGAPGTIIVDDIQRTLRTSVVGNMFTNVSRNSISFPEFFALEMEYILRKIQESKRNVYSSAATLQLCIEELHDKTWLARIQSGEDVPLNLANLKRIKYTLTDHQKQFLAWYSYAKDRYSLNGMLLAAAPGAGKTISCISVAETIEADAVIVISPANAVENVWQRTLNEDMTVDTPNWVSKFKDTMPVPKNCKYFIFHYEDLHVAIAMVSKGIIKGNKIAIFLDESHNFNDINSQRTQRFEMLCKLTKSNNIIYSSGTPIKAMGADTIPLLRVLDPYFNDEAEFRFRKIFGKNAAKANDLLANRLAIISYKVPKEKFRPVKPIEIPLKVKIPNAEYYTLPAIKVRMTKFIDERARHYKSEAKNYEQDYFTGVNIAKMHFNAAEKEDFKRYESIVNRFHKFGFDSYSDGPDAKWANSFEKNVIMPKLGSDMKRIFKDAKSVYKYVDLKIRGEALGNVLSKERNDAIVALANQIDYRQIIDTSKKKVIFFASHTEAVHTVVKRTRALGYHPLMVTAETNKDLKAIVGKFSRDAKANPLAATFQSLSAAVPLVDANTVVALNTPFRSLDMEQAIARVDRMGQDSQVYVYICTIDTGEVPNISTRSADIMEWSREQVAQIMGYKSREDLEIDDIPTMESFGMEPTDFNDPELSITTDTVSKYQEFMQEEELEVFTDDYDIPTPTDNLASQENKTSTVNESNSIDDFI